VAISFHKQKWFKDDDLDRHLDIDEVKDGVSLDNILADIEKAYIKKALEYSGGNKQKAAELLGMRYHTMWHRLNKLGLETKMDK